jgi:hypothetical protein
MSTYLIEFTEYKSKLIIMLEPESAIAAYQIERKVYQSIKLRDRTH